MSERLQFADREEFRAWLSEHCQTHDGVWLVDRLNKNLKPMEKG